MRIRCRRQTSWCFARLSCSLLVKRDLLRSEVLAFRDPGPEIQKGRGCVKTAKLLF